MERRKADGIRAGVKSRNAQIALAGAEACARGVGNSNGTSGRVGVQVSSLSKLLGWKASFFLHTGFPPKSQKPVE